MTHKFHKPHELVLQGFKSFKELQTFTFPDELSKLYFITGRNEVEPALEANGCGKSTLLDAIIYCLYGKTGRGLRASDIETWGTTGCSVTYSFSINEDYYSVTRTRAPITLTVNKNEEGSRVVEQADIDELIGLDYSSFLYAVVFPQFTPAFFDLKPTDKTDLFNSILNLDYWLQLSSEAKKTADFYAGFVSDYDKSVTETKARIQEVERQDFDEELKQWNARQQDVVEQYKAKIAKNTKELKALKEQGKSLIDEKTKANEKVKELDNVYKEIVLLKNELAEVVAVEDQKVAVARHSITVATKEREKFDTLSGVCQTCKQPIDEDHIDTEIAKLEEQISEAKKQVQDVTASTKALKDDLDLVKDEIAKVREESEEFKQQVKECDFKITICKRDSSRLMNELTDYREKLEDVENKTNPYVKKKQERDEYLKVLNETVQKDLKEMAEVKAKVERYHYWVKGFKQVRFYIIQNVLEQLEVEVNSCLYQLGLENWKVKFAMEQETKSNTIKKGFAVMIYSPYNVDPVPWEAWSGGESQRLRIAGMLGFANLLLARSGVSFAYEMFDEPSSWLSPRGIQDLIEVLNNRAKNEMKQIWIIDHRSLEFSFDGVVTIVKTLDGSEIVND